MSVFDTLFSRIVWDIFPRGDRLIRVVVGAEGGAGAGDTWGDTWQTMPSVMDVLATVRRPSTETRDSGVVAGVRQAEWAMGSNLTQWDWII